MRNIFQNPKNVASQITHACTHLNGGRPKGKNFIASALGVAIQVYADLDRIQADLAGDVGRIPCRHVQKVLSFRLDALPPLAAIIGGERIAEHLDLHHPNRTALLFHRMRCIRSDDARTRRDPCWPVQMPMLSS